MRKCATRRVVAGCGALILFVSAILCLRIDVQSKVPVKGDVADFTDTVILATLDISIDPNKNVIWCGTMALAWNEAMEQMKGPLIFSQPVPLADLLNRQEFTNSDLDPESYVVMAGFKVGNVEEKFREALRQKFGETANPPDLDTANSRDTDIALFAYLYKNLEFTTPFNVNAPLKFTGRNVANFGFGFERYPVSDAPSALISQVKLLAYHSEDDFIIELKTKSSQDQLILAKISPGKTLKTTVEAVLANLKDGEWGIDKQDKLAIPKIDFDLLVHFKELEKQELKIGTISLNTVAENIVFRLNEKGVELKGFTTITETLDAISPPPKPLNLVFDKPFLILLKRESSPRPYFAMWIGNATLLDSP